MQKDSLLMRTSLTLWLVATGLGTQAITKRPIFIPSKNRVNSRQPQDTSGTVPLLPTLVATTTEQSTSFTPELPFDSPSEPTVEAPTTEDRSANDSKWKSDIDLSEGVPYPVSIENESGPDSTAWVGREKPNRETTNLEMFDQTLTTQSPSISVSFSDTSYTATPGTEWDGIEEAGERKITSDIDKLKTSSIVNNNNEMNQKQKSLCELHICDCSNFKVLCRCRESSTGIEIQQHLRWIPHQTEEIQFTDCGYVGLRNGALANLQQLQKAEFTNIKDIIIDRNGLSIPKAKVPSGQKREIIFSSSSIAVQQGSVTGFLGDLTFAGVTINSIGQSSFNNLVLETLTIFRSEIITIEAGGFSNCTIKWLNITGSELQQIKEDAMDIKGLTDVILDGNVIGDVNSNSINIKGHESRRQMNKFWFENNVVEKVWKHGISATDFDIAHIAKNWFKKIDGNSFERIPTTKTRILNSTFVNNEFASYERSALVFSSTLTVENLKLPDKCSCSLMGRVGKWLVENEDSDSKKRDSKTVSSGSNWNKEELDILEDQILCRESGKHLRLTEYNLQRCTSSQREKPKNQTLCNYHRFCDCFPKLGSNISRTVVHCSCEGKSMDLTPLYGPGKLPSDTSELRIIGCSNFFIRNQSMAHLDRLEEVKIWNTGNVVIEPNGLSIPISPTSLRMEFKQTKIQVGVFRGIFESLEFNDVEFLSSMMPKFFSDLRANKITFYRSRITDIQPGAFLNVKVSNITFRDCNILAIREGGIRIAVGEAVAIVNNTIAMIQNKSVNLKWAEPHQPSRGLLFANNFVERLYQDAFVTVATGPVFFRDNVFSWSQANAFHSLEQDMSYKPEFVFESNEFQDYDKSSLIVPPYFKVRNLKLDTECTCKLGELEELLVAKSSASTPINTTIKDKNTNAHITNHGSLTVRSILMCRFTSEAYISIEEYESGYCGINDSQNLVFKILIPTVAVLFLLILLVVTICLLRRTRELKKKEKKTTQLQEQITSLNMLGPVLWGKRQNNQQIISLQPDILADAKKSDRADSWIINKPNTEIQTHPMFLSRAEIQQIEEPHIYEVL